MFLYVVNSLNERLIEWYKNWNGRKIFLPENVFVTLMNEYNCKLKPTKKKKKEIFLSFSSFSVLESWSLFRSTSFLLLYATSRYIDFVYQSICSFDMDLLYYDFNFHFRFCCCGYELNNHKHSLLNDRVWSSLKLFFFFCFSLPWSLLIGEWEWAKIERKK